jgi:hypothetical protein
MVLSRQALEMLAQMFGTQSNLQLPAAVAHLIVEIREAVQVAIQKETQPNG